MLHLGGSLGDLSGDETRERRKRREAVRRQYTDLFDEIEAILFRHDPIGINFEVNPDEYEPEVGTILLRAINATSVEETFRIVHEEFIRWFGSDIAGGPDRYTRIADDVYAAVQAYRSRT